MQMHKLSNFHIGKLEIVSLLAAVTSLVLISNGHYFLIWVAFSPLIFIALKRNLRTTLVISALYGIIGSVLFFEWVYSIKTEYYLKLYLFAISVFAFYFILFLSSLSWLSRKIQTGCVVLLAPVLWTAILLISQLISFDTSWMDIAIFHPQFVPFIWYFGSYGVSFLIMLFNSMIAYLFLHRKKQFVVYCALIIAFIGASYLYTNLSEFPKDGKQVKVALLQGNFPDAWSYRQKHAFGILMNTYINLTLEAGKEKPDIIVWPEYAIPQDFSRNETAFKRIQNIAAQLNTTVIVGTLFYQNNSRKYTDSAVVFSNEIALGKYESAYPYFFDKDVVKGSPVDEISIGQEKFGITICNEETIQKVSKSYVSKGSEFIVSLSNNQNLGSGSKILSQFTRLRAAENAKYIARATNDGITQIVNPHGKVINSIEPQKRKILIGYIYLNDYKTFYTKYGNILVYMLVLISILAMLKKR